MHIYLHEVMLQGSAVDEVSVVTLTPLVDGSPVEFRVLLVENETFWYYIGNDVSELGLDDPGFEENEEQFETDRKDQRSTATVSYGEE